MHVYRQGCPPLAHPCPHLVLQRRERGGQSRRSEGGFSAWAKKDRIKVIRKIDDKTVEYGFNYGAYTSGKAPDSNLLLMPGDTVVVPD